MMPQEWRSVLRGVEDGGDTMTGVRKSGAKSSKWKNTWWRLAMSSERNCVYQAEASSVQRLLHESWKIRLCGFYRKASAHAPVLMSWAEKIPVRAPALTGIFYMEGVRMGARDHFEVSRDHTCPITERHLIDSTRDREHGPALFLTSTRKQTEQFNLADSHTCASSLQYCLRWWMTSAWMSISHRFFLVMIAAYFTPNQPLFYEPYPPQIPRDIELYSSHWIRSFHPLR